MADAQKIWPDVQAIREKGPLVHNITNYVVMHTSANTLLAIGASPVMAHAVEEVEAMDVDYLGVSPIYFTPTKTDLKRELGLDGLREIKSFSRHPLAGIGGLNASNAVEVIRNGADGVAVVSAICAAEDPEAATRELAYIVQNAKKGES